VHFLPAIAMLLTISLPSPAQVFAATTKDPVKTVPSAAAPTSTATNPASKSNSSKPLKVQAGATDKPPAQSKAPVPAAAAPAPTAATASSVPAPATPPSPTPVAAITGPTQRDWMRNLVDTLGLSFGLPATPEDQDYRNILGGNRHFRFEAEEVHQPTDLVSVSSVINFGPFSGRGWVNGVAQPTEAHLRFLLPLAGRYRLSSSLRLSGHQFKIGNATLTNTEAGDKFHIVTLGEIDLPAGETEVVVSLPADASIDYLELDAAPLPAIAPHGGWRPEAPLTADDIAVTISKFLDLEAHLPPAGTSTSIEAESAGHSPGAAITDIRHLGVPSNGRWLRAGNAPTTVDIVFTPPAAGVYDISVRGLAEGPVTATVGQAGRFDCHFRPYLSDISIGSIALPAEPVHLEIKLPPRAGLDALHLRGRASRGSDYLRLVGLAEKTISDPMVMNRLLALAALLQPPR